MAVRDQPSFSSGTTVSVPRLKLELGMLVKGLKKPLTRNRQSTGPFAGRNAGFFHGLVQRFSGW